MDVQKALEEALTLARQNRGFCSPNPAVGALVIKDGQIIARGSHCGSGNPHAEVVALERPGDWAKGATLVVTLEPCCHWGKTPPCTELVKERELGKVIFAYEDPNPAVSGKGAAALKESGIEVVHTPTDAITSFYESYAYWTAIERPFVTAKLALSLDGKIAGARGAPVSITGPKVKEFTYEGRLRADAILTTAKTVLNDDPQLNVRTDGKCVAKPLYILDRNLSVPMGMKIFDTAKEITIFCSEACSEMQMAEASARGIKLIPVPADESGLSLPKVLDHIGKAGVHDLWVEAGGQCFQALLEQGLVNRAFFYVAPDWLGEDAQRAFSDSIGRLLGQARIVGWRHFDLDAVCELRWD